MGFFGGNRDRDEERRREAEAERERRTRRELDHANGVKFAFEQNQRHRERTDAWLSGPRDPNSPTEQAIARMGEGFRQQVRDAADLARRKQEERQGRW